MPKNWRLAVCTRYRPLVCTLLTITLFIGLGILIPFIQNLGTIPYSTLIRNAHSLKVGMSKEELIQMMGKPAYVRTISSEDQTSLIPWEEKGIGDLLQEYGQICEYFYDRGRFGSSASNSIEGIYLDREQKRIVSLRVSLSHWDLVPTRALIEGLLLLAACIALPWIGLRLWCRTQQRKYRSVEEDPKRSIDA